MKEGEVAFSDRQLKMDKFRYEESTTSYDSDAFEQISRIISLFFNPLLRLKQSTI